MNKKTNKYWSNIKPIQKYMQHNASSDPHFPSKKNQIKADKFIKRPWASKNVRKLLQKVSSELASDYNSRNNDRRHLFYGLLFYFIISSLFVICFICFTNQNYKLKAVVVSGFFIHLIGLFAVEFKYAFSSSREYSDFAINLLKWVNKENALELKYQELDHKLNMSDKQLKKEASITESKLNYDETKYHNKYINKIKMILYKLFNR